MIGHVKEWGDENNPTVVLLHPAGGTRHNWTPHAEELLDRYHVVALDLPAHGNHPMAEFSFDRAVEDVGHVLDEVGSAVVGGHSQGGYVSLRAAATYDTAVDGLLLAGASYNLRSPKLLALTAFQYPLSYVLEVLSYSDRASERVLETFGADIDPRQEPPEEEEIYSTLHGTAQSIRATCFTKTWPYIDEYNGPVLAAHGDDESAGSHAKELATRKNVRLQWYEGSHEAPMENHHECATIIREFLDSIYQ